eukprot:COSAG05_NODE_3522_length_2010_cov_9.746729_2_plen_276_part_00
MMAAPAVSLRMMGARGCRRSPMNSSGHVAAWGPWWRPSCALPGGRSRLAMRAMTSDARAEALGAELGSMVAAAEQKAAEEDVAAREVIALGEALEAELAAQREASSKFDAAAALSSAPKSKEGAVDLYDSWADDYDQTLRDWGYEAPERVAALVAEFHPQAYRVMTSLPILDCGCGTGMAADALQAASLEYRPFGADPLPLVGCDVSEASLEISRQKLVYSKLVASDLEQYLPFEDNSFSSVVCVGVTSYVHDFDMLFREWCRTTGAMQSLDQQP